MSEKSEKKADPAPAQADPAPPAPTQTVVVAMSAADMAREREMQAINRLQAARDARRAAAPEVELEAIVGFTLVTDDDPDGRVVRPGERFTVSEFDLPAYLGRARRPAAEDVEQRGATVS